MAETALVIRGPAPGNDGSTEIALTGPITHGTTPELRDHLRRILEAGPRAPELRLDLSCCTSINVDGMLALAVAQHAARTRGGDLFLVRVPPLIARQLHQHNFDELVPGQTWEESADP